MDKWGTLAIIANVVSILAGIFAGIAAYQTVKLRRENRRLQQWIPVKITFQQKDEDPKIYEFPIQLRRGEIKRSEVLGMIGMLPMKEKAKRFEIAHFNSKAFRESLDRLLHSDAEDVLEIPCTKEELEQFDIKL
jgi:hypothetical protein